MTCVIINYTIERPYQQNRFANKVVFISSESSSSFFAEGIAEIGLKAIPNPAKVENFRKFLRVFCSVIVFNFRTAFVYKKICCITLHQRMR